MRSDGHLEMVKHENLSVDLIRSHDLSWYKILGNAMEDMCDSGITTDGTSEGWD
ncbi:34350_t:CDS:2, partial [Gigaspora margarita]